MVIPSVSNWISPRRLFQMAFRAKADSEFIVFRDERLTRRQVYTAIQRLAAGLQALGVRKGDRVATLLPARPEAVYASLLPPFLGSVHVPLNPLLSERELRHILTNCGAKVVITCRNWYGQDHPQTLAQLLPELPDLRHVVICDAKDGDGRVFLTLDDVLSRGHALQGVGASADDITFICYTSGTTGAPRGAAHIPRRIWSILPRFALSRLRSSPLQCLLLPLPLYYLSGPFAVTAALLSGGKVVLLDRFDPEWMLRCVQEERVTQIAGSPTMYRWLVQAAARAKYDLSSLQRVTASTEFLPADLAQEMYGRFQCSIENIYGTTESMLISCTGLDDSWEVAATTVGKPVPGARVQVVDDARRPLPLGEHGEIAVQTPQMMIGYYRDPELTAQVLDEEGWFYTGDVGWLGEDGYLRLVGRKKDVIVRGGEKVYAAVVERRLERHPVVRRAAVIGVPSRLGDEEVWAYLELLPGASLGVKDVLDFCRGQMLPSHVPSQVRFVDHLPMLATGKVKKHRLLEMAQEELAGGERDGSPYI